MRLRSLVCGVVVALSLGLTWSPSTFGQAVADRVELEPKKAIPIQGGAVTLNPKTTRIQFVGTHVGPTPDPNARVGTFEDFVGKIEVDEDELRAIEVEIKTASLKTPMDNLSNHLRSPDFFDARQHPTAKFVSREIVPGVDGQVEVVGDLTMLGKTEELRFPATVSVGPEGVTLQGTFSFDRTKFGMTGLTDKVNKDVEMTVVVGEL